MTELYAVVAILVYGLGTLAFAVFGAAFFFWFLVLALFAAPFAAVAVRRRRRRLQRLRVARRRARTATYAEPWLEWEEAA
jgi:hypothetical protein